MLKKADLYLLARKEFFGGNGQTVVQAPEIEPSMPAADDNNPTAENEL